MSALVAPGTYRSMRISNSAKDRIGVKEMTDIVIRALTRGEAHELRLLKIQLEERNWRTLMLRIIRDWKKNRTGIVPVIE